MGATGGSRRPVIGIGDFDPQAALAAAEGDPDAPSMIFIPPPGMTNGVGHELAREQRGDVSLFVRQPFARRNNSLACRSGSGERDGMLPGRLDFGGAPSPTTRT